MKMERQIKKVEINSNKSGESANSGRIEEDEKENGI